MKRILIPILLFLAACSTSPSTETFIMSLGNVGFPGSDPPNVLEVPNSIKAGEAIKIRVSVAGGGCISFSKFESKRTAERLELTPIGISPLNVNCTADYRTWWVDYLDEASTARSNPFTVIVHQANGADLERSVTITP
jgi:hypothetical protein